MMYDRDGVRIRLTSERARRLCALNAQRQQLEERIRRTTDTIAVMNESSEHKDVPEYALALASLERRLLQTQGMLTLVNRALAVLELDMEASPKERGRWRNQRKRNQDDV